MTIIDSIILGIVEGLTEYLPVSSTGHLIVTRYLLGLGSSDALKAFEVCIQGGAILAVLGLYRKRVVELFEGLMGKSETGKRLLINVIVAFLPAAILGLIFEPMIKHYLFNEKTVMIMWAVGGLIILLYCRHREKKGLNNSGLPLEQLSVKGALSIGLLQCIAMCPGTSRSLMTMLGGLFVGLSMAATVEFSFLLGVITLGAATVWDAMNHGPKMVEQIGWGPIIVGTIVAWAAAVVSVRWMVGYLNRHGLVFFGWYRIVAAIVMLVLIFTGLSFDAEDEDPAPDAPVTALVQQKAALVQNSEGSHAQDAARCLAE